MITLVLVSAIYGVVAALVFRRFTNRASIRRSMNRILAHTMELGLFLDSPGLVFRAQRDLLRENARLLRQVILPGAIVALLFSLLYPAMDAFYGYAPLPPGEPSVVTIQMKDAMMPPVELEAPLGMAVETPGVRSLHDRQISWRVRPLGRTTGELKIRYRGGTLTKRIVAGNGLVYATFSSPGIRLQYPRTTILGANWMVWFFLISTATAIGYRG